MKVLKLFIAALLLSFGVVSATPTYSLVNGIDRFEGSAAAWRLLETNGFVVADPVYGQIFEPYLDPSFPPFITTDSAWDTYQTLLALGVRQLELKGKRDSDLFAGSKETFRDGGQIHSGLDFFVACPELRSPSASRALRQNFGTAPEQTLENLNYILPPNSLGSDSLRLLANLQQPVSGPAGTLFRSEAWADEQLWSQLGAWVEQPRRDAINPAPNDFTEPPEEASKLGAVAPYPEFFAGLARLSRETQAAMEKAGLDEAFDAKAIAQKMLDDIFIQQGLVANEGQGATTIAAPQTQFKQFAEHYSESQHAGGGENSPASQQLLKNLEAVARRCLDGNAPNEADQAVLQGFYDERRTTPRLLREFADACDKLAELAGKQANAIPFSEGDREWIANYGAMLARLHFEFAGDSVGSYRDFPTVGFLATNSDGGSVFCAGLGRPETLYVILPAADGRLHLFRGAVLSYLEGVQTNSAAPDSTPNRDLRTPAFTASFRAEKCPVEILDSLASGVSDRQDLRDIQQNLTALESRVTDADLPMLVARLGKADAAWAGTPIAPGIAAAISRLNWAPEQDPLLSLLTNKDDNCAGSAATILLQHPNWVDGDRLCANFDHVTVRARRVYLILLTGLQPDDKIRAALLGALRDDVASVRWQAATAVLKSSWDPAQKTAPLLERLSDTNEFVAAVAARALGKIGTATVAPILFSNLQLRLQAPAPSNEKLMEQRAAIQDYLLGYMNGATNLFDPDGFLGREPFRRPRFPVDFRREQQLTATSALIEALGDLHYEPVKDLLFELLAGPNGVAAADALKKIAPDKLTIRLTAIASDKTALPQVRDRALALLGDAANANAMAGVIPLLDDQTVIPILRPIPGREWRICDRAAATLSALSGRVIRITPMMQTDERDRQIEQVRQMLKTAY